MSIKAFADNYGKHDTRDVAKFLVEQTARDIAGTAGGFNLFPGERSGILVDYDSALAFLSDIHALVFLLFFVAWIVFMFVFTDLHSSPSENHQWDALTILLFVYFFDHYFRYWCFVMRKVNDLTSVCDDFDQGLEKASTSDTKTGGDVVQGYKGVLDRLNQGRLYNVKYSWWMETYHTEQRGSGKNKRTVTVVSHRGSKSGYMKSLDISEEFIPSSRASLTVIDTKQKLIWTDAADYQQAYDKWFAEERRRSPRSSDSTR